MPQDAKSFHIPSLNQVIPAIGSAATATYQRTGVVRIE